MFFQTFQNTVISIIGKIMQSLDKMELTWLQFNIEKWINILNGIGKI